MNQQRMNNKNIKMTISKMVKDHKDKQNNVNIKGNIKVNRQEDSHR